MSQASPPFPLALHQVSAPRCGAHEVGRWRGASAVLALTTALLLPCVARAEGSGLVPEAGYDYGEEESARSIAVGGATRALGNGSTALYSNPAGMALTRVYHLEGRASIWPDAKRQSYGGAAVDSVTSRMAGGLGAQFGTLDPQGVARKWTDLRFALAFPFSEKLFAGASLRYLKLRQNGAGPLGASYASGGLHGEPIVDGVTFDAGLLLRAGDHVAIGALGTNLTNPGTAFQPTTFGGGVAFGNDDLTIEGNVVGDFTTFTRSEGTNRTTVRAMLGAEYLAGDHFPLRLGYRYDEGLSSHALSAGLGYIDRQFAIEVGGRRTVSGPAYATPSTAVVIALQYFLESSGLTRAPGDFEQ